MRLIASARYGDVFALVARVIDSEAFILRNAILSKDGKSLYAQEIVYRLEILCLVQSHMEHKMYLEELLGKNPLNVYNCIKFIFLVNKIPSSILYIMCHTIA